MLCKFQRRVCGGEERKRDGLLGGLYLKHNLKSSGGGEECGVFFSAECSSCSGGNWAGGQGWHCTFSVGGYSSIHSRICVAQRAGRWMWGDANVWGFMLTSRWWRYSTAVWAGALFIYQRYLYAFNDSTWGGWVERRLGGVGGGER